MAKQLFGPAARRLLTVAVLAGFLTLGLGLRPAVAGKLDQLDASLRLVPEKAAFYCSSLRLGEQVEAVAKSRAWAKIMEMPVVEMGLKLYKEQSTTPGTGPAQIQMALDNPQVQRGLAMLGDMFSHEVFFYGEEDVADVFKLFQQLSTAMNGANFRTMAARDFGRSGQLGQRQILTTLVENRRLLKVPNLLVGFKLTDTQRAVELLAQVELLGSMALDSNPQTKGHWKRTKVGKFEYLTLSLDGSMIPWDQVHTEELGKMEAKPGDADKLIEHLKKMTLVVALGVRDNYLLASIGPSTAALERLGAGTHLSQRVEFQPLEKFAGGRIASIGYISKAFMAQISNPKQQIEQWRSIAEDAISGAKLKPTQAERIRKDLGDLAKDLKAAMPEPGAAMSFDLLTPRGTEGYGYQWGAYSNFVGSKPLGLLSHLDGSPLTAIVCHGKPCDVRGYETFVKWLRLGFGYFEEFAVPQMTADEREKFKKFTGEMHPLLERLDKANRTMLLPSLADGQMALVLDAKLRSKHFVKSWPATPMPMPMIEPALVFGVSDAPLLRKACQEYWAVIGGTIRVLRKVDPNSIPEFDLPQPVISKTAAGEIAGYAPPAHCGVDPAIFFNAGLSEHLAVLSVSRRHTERLLATTPLNVGGLLTEPNRPRALAGFLNWPALVDAATPWVELATKEVLAENSGADAQAIKAQVGPIDPQVHTVLELLKVVRGVTFESYYEQNAFVTHSLVEIRDVK
jgi:hypothetical protein